MGELRYSINITVDGCCDHLAGIPTEAIHRHAEKALLRGEALLFGRVVYQMMEEGWRRPAPQTPEWMLPFARTIDAVRKYVVSSTLEEVDWNAELVRGELGPAVEALKARHPGGLLTGGVTLPLALAELGLIDEYEFVVHPRIAGRGPTVLAGLSKYVDLEFVEQVEVGAGAVAMRYRPRG